MADKRRMTEKQHMDKRPHMNERPHMNQRQHVSERQHVNERPHMNQRPRISEKQRMERRRQIEEQRRRIAQERKKRKLRRFCTCAVLVIVSTVSFWFGKKVGEGKTNINTGGSGILSGTVGTHTDSGNASQTAGYLQDTFASHGVELLLVNKENKLPEYYSVELVLLPDGKNQAAEIAYEPLCTMLADGRKEGLSFEICSSYRTVERQQELLEEDIKALMKQGYDYDVAYSEVTRETMPPGYSEHSSGLAFDIVALSYQMLDSGQEKRAENKWLQEHCAEYGFILRYPKGKEEITGIDYESWHFRYVGVEAAAYIMENEITLEEYLEDKNRI